MMVADGAVAAASKALAKFRLHAATVGWAAAVIAHLCGCGSSPPLPRSTAAALLASDGRGVGAA